MRSPPPTPLAAFVGVGIRHRRLEVAVWALRLDPAKKGLEFFGLAERVERVEALVELLIGVGGVELFVAEFAERRTVLGLAAALFGLEVVEGDEVGGDEALAEGAGLVGRGAGHG